MQNGEQTDLLVDARSTLHQLQNAEHAADGEHAGDADHVVPLPPVRASVEHPYHHDVTVDNVNDEIDGILRGSNIFRPNTGGRLDSTDGSVQKGMVCIDGKWVPPEEKHDGVAAAEDLKTLLLPG